MVPTVSEDQMFTESAYGQSDVGAQVIAEVEVGSPMVLFIGVVRGPVVLKPVYPAVVVHVQAEEELRRVHAVSKERFLEIGDIVGTGGIVVLVEVGDEVVVLIQTGEDGGVGGAPPAGPVGKDVLVVVVLYEFVPPFDLFHLVHPGGKGGGAVSLVHGEQL